MWFRVDEEALDDPRIELVALKLGISDGDAFKACCRIWRWLYKRGGGLVPPEEIDKVSRQSGLAEQLIATGLADAHPDGLRIKGDKRADRYAAFCREQRRKSLMGRNQHLDSESVTIKTNGDPAACPPDEPPAGPIYILSSSSSGSGSPDPESGRARERQAEKRAVTLAAAEAWLEWFNRRFARSFRLTPELSKLVGALLAKGYSEKPDMRGVALYMRSQWEGDEKMARFLVPSTILRPTKFAERLDLAREWDHSCGDLIWVKP